MFRKIGKSKREVDDVDETGGFRDGQRSDDSDQKGPKEASLIYNGSKQVNVIVKGTSPLAVPKAPKAESSSRKSGEFEESQNMGDDSDYAKTDKSGCVEVDLNDDEEVPEPRHPNWRQQFIKKLQQMHAKGPPKNPNIMPTLKKEKKTLPGIFDFSYPPENLRLEYKFDEWRSDNLNPEYHDPPKKLSPISHKVQSFGHKYWGETFALIQPVADFVIALFLELLAFTARVGSRLLTGTLLRISDLLIKPLLVFTFNTLILPPCVVLQNIFKALGNAIMPLLEVINRLMQIIAIPIQAFRLVEIRHVNNYSSSGVPRNLVPYSQTNTIERDATMEESPRCDQV